MKAKLLALYLINGLAGVGLGIAYVGIGRSDPVPAAITIPALNPERSVLRPRQVRPSRQDENDQDAETRLAYHVPLAGVEAAIQRYYGNGWWKGVKILFERWSAEDPESAFAKAVKMEWPPAKRDTSISARGAHYQTTVGNWSSQVFGVIAKNWFQSDPEKALRAYLAFSESGEATSGYAEMAVSYYADHDPAEAASLGFARLSWKGSCQIGNFSRSGDERLATDTFAKWAKRDPYQAASTALASGIEDRSLLAAILGGIFTGWQEKDPEAAERWATGLDARLPLEMVRSRHIASLAKSDPLNALRLDAQRPSEDDQWDVIQTWSARDGLEVFDSIGDTPEPAETAYRATSVLVGRTEPRALGQAILTLSEDFQQRPLAKLAENWAHADRAAAEAFADEIPNPILRRVYINEINRNRSDEK